MSVYGLWPSSSLQYIFLSLWNNVTIIVCNTLPEIMQSNSSWILNQNNLDLKRQKFLYWKCSWRLVRVTSIPRAIVYFTEVSQSLPVLTHIQEMKKEASVVSSFFIVSLNENTKFLSSSTLSFSLVLKWSAVIFCPLGLLKFCTNLQTLTT